MLRVIHKATGGFGAQQGRQRTRRFGAPISQHARRYASVALVLTLGLGATLSGTWRAPARADTAATDSALREALADAPPTVSSSPAALADLAAASGDSAVWDHRGPQLVTPVVGGTVVDPATFHEYPGGNDLAYYEQSSNAGRIWIDKSVFSAESLPGYSHSGRRIDSYTWLESDNGERTWELGDQHDANYPADKLSANQLSVGVSVLTTTQHIHPEDDTPIDVVMIIDLSTSMRQCSYENAPQGYYCDSNTNWHGSRYNAISIAVNEAIDIIAQDNPRNRVALAWFHTTAGALPTAQTALRVPVRMTGGANDPWAGKYFDISHVGDGTDADGAITGTASSVTGAFTVRTAGDAPARAVSAAPVTLATGGSTNTQLGIVTGMQLLAKATNTTWEGSDGVVRPRIPNVILFSDGEPTYSVGATETGATDWWDWDIDASTSRSTNGSGNPQTSNFCPNPDVSGICQVEQYFGNGFKAAMAAAYQKNAIAANYRPTAAMKNGLSAAEQAELDALAQPKIFTISLGIGQLFPNGQQLALATLDPAQQHPDTTADRLGEMGTQFESAWQTYVTGGSPNVAVNAPAATRTSTGATSISGTAANRTIPGTGITHYYQTTTTTSAPSLPNSATAALGNWSANPPAALAADEYLWTMARVRYNGNAANTQSAVARRISGDPAARSIKQIEQLYQSTNSTTAPERIAADATSLGSWLTTRPTNIGAGQYLYNMTRVTYELETYSVTHPSGAAAEFAPQTYKYNDDFFSPVTTKDLVGEFQAIARQIANTSLNFPIPNTDSSLDVTKDGEYTDYLGPFMRVSEINRIDYCIATDPAEECEISSPFPFRYSNKTTSADKLTDTYTFTGYVKPSSFLPGPVPLSGSADSTPLTITVTHSPNLAVGDIVTVKLPVALIPIRNTEVWEDGLGRPYHMEVTGHHPMHIFYSVAPKDEVLWALAGKPLGSADNPATPQDVQALAQYLAAETNPNTGLVKFYANNWDIGVTDPFFSQAQTPNTKWTPAITNDFYRFAADTPLYTSRPQATPGIHINDGGCVSDAADTCQGTKASIIGPLAGDGETIDSPPMAIDNASRLTWAQWNGGNYQGTLYYPAVSYSQDFSGSTGGSTITKTVVFYETTAQALLSATGEALYRQRYPLDYNQSMVADGAYPAIRSGLPNYQDTGVPGLGAPRWQNLDHAKCATTFDQDSNHTAGAGGAQYTNVPESQLLQWVNRSPVCEHPVAGTETVSFVRETIGALGASQVQVNLGNNGYLAYAIEPAEPLTVSAQGSLEMAYDWRIEKQAIEVQYDDDGPVLNTVELDAAGIPVMVAGQPKQSTTTLYTPATADAEVGFPITRLPAAAVQTVSPATTPKAAGSDGTAEFWYAVKVTPYALDIDPDLPSPPITADSVNWLLNGIVTVHNPNSWAIPVKLTVNPPLNTTNQVGRPEASCTFGEVLDQVGLPTYLDKAERWFWAPAGDTPIAGHCTVPMGNPNNLHPEVNLPDDGLQMGVTLEWDNQHVFTVDADSQGPITKFEMAPVDIETANVGPINYEVVNVWDDQALVNNDDTIRLGTVDLADGPTVFIYRLRLPHGFNAPNWATALDHPNTAWLNENLCVPGPDGDACGYTEPPTPPTPDCTADPIFGEPLWDVACDEVTVTAEPLALSGTADATRAVNYQWQVFKELTDPRQTPVQAAPGSEVEFDYQVWVEATKDEADRARLANGQIVITNPNEFAVDLTDAVLRVDGQTIALNAAKLDSGAAVIADNITLLEQYGENAQIPITLTMPGSSGTNPVRFVGRLAFTEPQATITGHAKVYLTDIAPGAVPGTSTFGAPKLLNAEDYLVDTFSVGTFSINNYLSRTTGVKPFTYSIVYPAPETAGEIAEYLNIAWISDPDGTPPASDDQCIDPLPNEGVPACSPVPIEIETPPGNSGLTMVGELSGKYAVDYDWWIVKSLASGQTSPKIAPASFDYVLTVGAVQNAPQFQAEVSDYLTISNSNRQPVTVSALTVAGSDLTPSDWPATLMENSGKVEVPVLLTSSDLPFQTGTTPLEVAITLADGSVVRSSISLTFTEDISARTGATATLTDSWAVAYAEAWANAGVPSVLKAEDYLATAGSWGYTISGLPESNAGYLNTAIIVPDDKPEGPHPGGIEYCVRPTGGYMQSNVTNNDDLCDDDVIVTVVPPDRGPGPGPDPDPDPEPDPEQCVWNPSLLVDDPECEPPTPVWRPPVLAEPIHDVALTLFVESVTRGDQVVWQYSDDLSQHSRPETAIMSTANPADPAHAGVWAADVASGDRVILVGDTLRYDIRLLNQGEQPIRVESVTFHAGPELEAAASAADDGWMANGGAPFDVLPSGVADAGATDADAAAGLDLTWYGSVEIATDAEDASLHLDAIVTDAALGNGSVTTTETQRISTGHLTAFAEVSGLMGWVPNLCEFDPTLLTSDLDCVAPELPDVCPPGADPDVDDCVPVLACDDPEFSGFGYCIAPDEIVPEVPGPGGQSLCVDGMCLEVLPDQSRCAEGLVWDAGLAICAAATPDLSAEPFGESKPDSAGGDLPKDGVSPEATCEPPGQVWNVELAACVAAALNSETGVEPSDETVNVEAAGHVLSRAWNFVGRLFGNTPAEPMPQAPANFAFVRYDVTPAFHPIALALTGNGEPAVLSDSAGLAAADGAWVEVPEDFDGPITVDPLGIASVIKASNSPWVVAYNVAADVVTDDAAVWFHENWDNLVDSPDAGFLDSHDGAHTVVMLAEALPCEYDSTLPAGDPECKPTVEPPAKCPLDENLTADDPACQPCEYDPKLRVGDPACRPPESKVCEHDPTLKADDPACKPKEEVCVYNKALPKGHVDCVPPRSTRTTPPTPPARSAVPRTTPTPVAAQPPTITRTGAGVIPLLSALGLLLVGGVTLRRRRNR